MKTGICVCGYKGTQYAQAPHLPSLQGLHSPVKVLSCPINVCVAMERALLFFVAVGLLFASHVEGHGRLTSPRSRNWIEHTTAPWPIGYTSQAGNGRHGSRTSVEFGGRVLQPGEFPCRVGLHGHWVTSSWPAGSPRFSFRRSSCGRLCQHA